MVTTGGGKARSGKKKASAAVKGGGGNQGGGTLQDVDRPRPDVRFFTFRNHYHTFGEAWAKWGLNKRLFTEPDNKVHETESTDENESADVDMLLHLFRIRDRPRTHKTIDDINPSLVKLPNVLTIPSVATYINGHGPKTTGNKPMEKRRLLV